MMHELEKLYNAIEVLRQAGLPVKDQLAALQNKEAMYIDEVLQDVKQRMQEGLSFIPHDMEITFRYNASTKQVFTMIDDVPTPVTIPTSKPKAQGGKKKKVKKMGPATKLRVTMDDDSVYEEKNASDTFVKFVQWTGSQNIIPLGLKCCGVPLISSTPATEKRYRQSQKEIGDGYLLMTYCSTQSKKKYIEKIAEALDFWVEVEII